MRKKNSPYTAALTGGGFLFEETLTLLPLLQAENSEELLQQHSWKQKTYNDLSKLSKNAFAIMAMCENTKEPFGITVDPREGCYAFAWTFKIKKEQAKREGYDHTHVRGAVILDENFNGCPYCGSKNFYICSRCGKVVCYHGQEVVTCPNCGSSNTLQAAKNVDLSGGGF